MDDASDSRMIGLTTRHTGRSVGRELVQIKIKTHKIYIAFQFFCKRFLLHCWILRDLKTQMLQESIPVGGLPPTCQPYVFWWPSLGVSTSGGTSGPMSRVGGYLGYPPPLEIPTNPRTYPPPPEHTHPLLVTPSGHLWRHTHSLTDRHLKNITFPKLCRIRTGFSAKWNNYSKMEYFWDYTPKFDILLPPAIEVWGKVMFLNLSVSITSYDRPFDCPIICTGIYYRPQRSWAKVMFLQASDILLTGGGGGLPRPPRKETPPVYGQWAAGTHPTGMHSCSQCIVFIDTIKLIGFSGSHICW